MRRQADTVFMAANIEKLAYFHSLRSIARERTIDQFNRHLRDPESRAAYCVLEFGDISSAVLNYVETHWLPSYGDDTHSPFPYGWNKIHQRYLTRLNRFEVAIWQDVDGVKRLQGLALGRVSKGKQHVCLDWVERTPEKTYFKGGILLPVLTCLQEYACLLDCERTLIKNPIDPEAYKIYGYVPFDGIRDKANYLAMELE